MLKFFSSIYIVICVNCFCFDKYSIRSNETTESQRVELLKKFPLDLNFDGKEDAIFYKKDSSFFWVSLVVGNTKFKTLKIPFQDFSNSILKIENFKISIEKSTLIFIFEGQKSFAGKKSFYRRPLIISFQHTGAPIINFQWAPVIEFLKKDWMGNTAKLRSELKILSTRKGSEIYLVFKAQSMDISLKLNNDQLVWRAI
jgi:hypothetical protein